MEGKPIWNNFQKILIAITVPQYKGQYVEWSEHKIPCQ